MKSHVIKENNLVISYTKCLNLKTLKPSIKDLLSSKRNMYMKGSGRITKEMVEEPSNGKEDLSMKDTGKTMLLTGMVG